MPDNAAAKRLIGEAWARTAPPADLATPESQGLTRADGWPISYSTPGGDSPQREVFNNLYLEWTSAVTELFTKGIYSWDSAVTYDHPAAAMGSDNKLYLSVRDSTNVNPVTNTTYTDWQPITRSMRDDIVDAIDAALGSANWQQGGGMFSQTQTDYSETDSTDVAFLENRQLIAPLASPGFTGQPTAPTPGSNNDSARIATTAWVQDRIVPLAPLASPALTGNPTAPTQSSGNDSTRLATTAFVRRCTSY